MLQLLVYRTGSGSSPRLHAIRGAPFIVFGLKRFSTNSQNVFLLCFRCTCQYAAQSRAELLDPHRRVAGTQSFVVKVRFLIAVLQSSVPIAVLKSLVYIVVLRKVQGCWTFC